MGGGDLLHYIQAKDMGRIFSRLRSVQCRQNGRGIADAVIRYGQAEALPCLPGVHGNVHRL